MIMKRLCNMQPVLQQKKSGIQDEIADVSREQQVINYRQAVYMVVREVSEEFISCDKLSRQHKFANTCNAITLDVSTDGQLLFRNELAAYLEFVLTNDNVHRREAGLARVAARLSAAAAVFYHSLGAR